MAPLNLRVRSFLLHLAFSIPLFVLDQLTKQWIVNRFPNGPTYPGEEIAVIPGFFNIVRVHNTGMAFGIGNQGGYSNVIFVSIAVVALTFLTVLWLKDSFPTKTSKFAVTLLVAGIFGNVFDRLTRGYVVDFLDFQFGSYHWPSFNVADACICVAAGLLFLTAVRGYSSEDKSEPAASPE